MKHWKQSLNVLKVCRLHTSSGCTWPTVWICVTCSRSGQPRATCLAWHHFDGSWTDRRGAWRHIATYLNVLTNFSFSNHLPRMSDTRLCLRALACCPTLTVFLSVFFFTAILSRHSCVLRCAVSHPQPSSLYLSFSISYMRENINRSRAV